jgi:hypothetical protein
MEELDSVEEEKNLRHELALLGSVKELMGMPGWAVVDAHFKQVLQVINDQILNEEDPKKMLRLQERFRAFKSMLETVEALCQQHGEALLRLENLEAEKQERDQYGKT